VRDHRAVRPPTKTALVILSALAGCQGAPTDDPAAMATEVGSVLLGPIGDVEGSKFLRGLLATSGRDADRVLDGDVRTGWTPSGDAVGEGLTLQFEEPSRATALVLRACDGSSTARWQAVVDGVIGPTFSLAPGREERVELGADVAGRAMRTLSLRILSADEPGVCVAELGIAADRALLPMRPPRSVHGRIRASSTKEPADAWQAAWLVDGIPETAWAEGTLGGGDGERVLITLDEPAEIVAVEIWNGDQRSDAARLAAGRVRRLRLELDGATPVGLDLADQPGPQRLELPDPVVTAGISLVVEGALTGESGDDTTLSELRLFDRHGPVSVRTNDALDRADAVREQIAGTPLAAFVDHRWGSVCGVPPRSWKLRGNLGFVRDDGAASWGEGAPVAEVMEGRWVAGPSEGAWATVRLEGVRRRADATWTADDPDRARAAQGEIRLAFARDLGQAGLKQVLDGWKDQRSRVGCLTEELGAWSDAWDALLARDAVVVQGDGLSDLLWREGL
jgi:hypothetical protein